MTILGIVSRPYLEEVFAQWNQRLLYWQSWPGAGIFTMHPITTLADLKGVTIRAFDPISAEWIKLAGGTPITMPWGDVYMALATGAIDAVITSTVSGADGKFWEVIPYFTDLGFTFGFSAVTVNLDAWERLPDDIKVIVLETAREIEDQQILRSLRTHVAAKETLIREGMTVNPITPQLRAEAIEVSEAIWAGWLKKAGPDGEAIFNEFLELVGRR